MSEQLTDEQLERARFENSAPIDEQQRRIGRGLGLAIASSALALPLAFFLTLKPTSARAVWEEFARIIEFRSAGSAGEVKTTVATNEKLAALSPQSRAELMLQETERDYDAAGKRMLRQMDSFRGRLTMTPRLNGLLDAGLNSSDIRVRVAAVEMELAAYDLTKTAESAQALVKRAETDPAGRSWALWMLGALGGRGVETEQASPVLLKYSHDANEKTRYWAVEGLSLLGTDATVPSLLEIFHSDPSLTVRERAGCGLAQCGMLTKQQRMTAVPDLIAMGEDPMLDSNTKNWVYQALREITGEHFGTNSTDWREWWAEKSVR